MLPAELAKQIKLLEIKTCRIVDELTGGAYKSAFKGSGIEFDEVREYTQEDDVRDIDWNVSARMGTPYIKKFVEERELTVMLLVDVSASGAFGSAEKSKRRIAAELAALIAFSAFRSGDKVGLMMFSDKIELYLPPKSGRQHSLRLIREMLAFQPKSNGTNLNLALKETAQLMKKKGVVFLLSDLLSEVDFEKELRLLNARQDVVAVEFTDPIEQVWPVDFAVDLEDSENGESFSFLGGSQEVSLLNKQLEQLAIKKREICKRCQVDLIQLSSTDDVLKKVIDFFGRRHHRLTR